MQMDFIFEANNFCAGIGLAGTRCVSAGVVRPATILNQDRPGPANKPVLVGSGN
jgi:hypothetical protein